MNKNICPLCGYQFRGKGFDGIEAHWRSSHEDVMQYEEAWPLIKSGSYPPPKITAILSLPFFRRPDRQEFDINVRLYELPVNADYWMAIYDAHHKEWGHRAFNLLIPKRLASTEELAQLIVEGSAFDQVKASLGMVTKEGWPIGISFRDGWVLI